MSELIANMTTTNTSQASQAHFESILEQRTSIGRYDASAQLDEEMVNELVRLACLAPSAFNLQNWAFVAVHSNAAKQRLYPLAFEQPQVLDAAVTYIVSGRMQGYKELNTTLQASVDAKIISEGVQKTWVEMASQTHQESDQARRDEAIRSASLAAMSLMVAAQEKGLASGAMGGFDAQAVKAEFALEEDSLPVILITVGVAGEGNWPQKVRKPLAQVLRTL
ncbi:Nitroreductase [Marinomonas sp. MED121]|uniref:nitroreductase family protein n=1 Tax=Marinomonas sp. MED121 TaxID=314277 RepID=UPI0000690A11|nr:nitroreductase family protein [Marinomonas sp. MED121]EAQ63992.1 Nitroreductase [Marinomonas sp. MED121]